MAINFVTGLPRAGKTLYTICRIKEISEKDSRPVYYCNIPGITIPGWVEIDHPDKWMDVEDGSIILVDELQDFWGKNAPGQKVPTPILELSKHGKRGIDFWFITQEPNLVHTTPRDLCQHHYYVVRAFGMQKAIIYKFQRMQTRPQSATKKDGVETYPWSYPKKAFEWYKSADMHNVKRQLPLRLLAIPVVLAAAIAAGWFAVSQIGGFWFGDKPPIELNAPNAPGANPLQLPPGQARPAGPQPERIMTAADYVAHYTPRLEDLPHTAPAYDELTKPKQVPYPAGCIATAAKCHCFTAQATPLQIRDAVCRDIAAKGIFVPWLDPAQQTPATPPQQYTQAQPQQPAVGTLDLKF